MNDAQHNHRPYPIVDATVAAVNDGDATEGTRYFFELRNRLGVDASGRVLQQRLGGTWRAKVIRIFAKAPCLMCRGGCQQCPNCEGQVFSDAGHMCDPCLGLGVTRCDFCDGTATLSLEDVPAELRYEVAAYRCRQAADRLGKLIAQPIGGTGQATPASSFKRNAKELILLDGQLAALEAAANLLSGCPDMGEPQRRQLGNQLRKALSLTKGAENRLKNLLRGMCKAAECRARQTPQGSRQRQRELQRVRFYDTLRHHPQLLIAALDRARLHRAYQEVNDGAPQEQVRRSA